MKWLSVILVSLAPILWAQMPRAAFDFRIVSPAFHEGDSIPPRYACDGMNMSPPLSWTDPPAGTQSFALILIDSGTEAGMWETHWVAYNIPPAVRGLKARYGALSRLPDGTLFGRNYLDRTGYAGPCPGPRRTHRYFFKLYALDRKLPDRPGHSSAELGVIMSGHILAQTQLMGTYRRNF
jgi:Raf kinase inhibitor-like YbhB/YbcL family protein